MIMRACKAATESGQPEPTAVFIDDQRSVSGVLMVMELSMLTCE
jgi:hypothetical protein